MPGKKKSVGVIGLGIIGSRVAANLRKAGFEVWVWSRSPKPEPNFLASPAEVADVADRVSLYVSDGAALLETVRAMAPSLTERHIVANHATVGPAEICEAAAIAQEKSASLLDIPFTGSRDAAENGEIVYYAGGPAERIDRFRPILEASAKRILEVGEIGQASLIKIATNLISAATAEALAEALALMDRNGVPVEKFAEALEVNAARSGVTAMKLPCMTNGDFEPRFALKHMFKDIQLVLGAAQASGLELPAANATAGALMAGIHKGWGDLDFSSVASHYGFPGKRPLAGNGAQAAPTDTATPGKPGAPERKTFRFFGRAKA